MRNQTPKKRILLRGAAAALALCMVLGFTACGKKKAPAAGVDIAGGIGVKNTLWRLNAFFEGNFDCRIANSEAGGFEIELRGGMTGGT